MGSNLQMNTLGQSMALRSNDAVRWLHTSVPPSMAVTLPAYLQTPIVLNPIVLNPIVLVGRGAVA